MTAAPGLHLRRVSLWRRLWRPFWALPAAVMVGSVALGVLVPQLERDLGVEVPAVFAGGPEGARSVLGTIATAMISVTGLVFSVTIVVLQLASSQFTPRILGSFLDGRIAQVTLGVFTGSFLYSLTVLRLVRGGADGVDAFVPDLAVTLSYVYVLASVAMFLAFIQHITSQVQVSRVISDLGHATVRGLGSVDEGEESPPAIGLHRPDGHGPAREVDLLLDERHGHVVAIDAATLTSHASEHDLLVLLDIGLGDFLVPGQILGVVVSQDGDAIDDEVLAGLTRCVHLERERIMDNDPHFGTRQLVDIAERALSPGINDPTTATQVVNEAHLVLRALSTRPDPSPVIPDSDGNPRATYRAQTFRAHLDLVVDELSFYGKDNVQVPGALSAMLDELQRHARDEHVPAIEDARSRALQQPGDGRDRAGASESTGGS